MLNRDANTTMMAKPYVKPMGGADRLAKRSTNAPPAPRWLGWVRVDPARCPKRPHSLPKRGDASQTTSFAQVPTAMGAPVAHIQWAICLCSSTRAFYRLSGDQSFQPAPAFVCAEKSIGLLSLMLLQVSVQAQRTRASPATRARAASHLRRAPLGSR